MSVDTYGWNTAFALPVSRFNELVASNVTVPPPRKFGFTADDGRKVDAEWTFAPWTVNAASGSQITLEIRFIDGHLVDGGGTVKLKDLVCLMTCEMLIKPRPSEETQADGITRNGVSAARRGSAKWAKAELNGDGRSIQEIAKIVEFLDAWFGTPAALAEFERLFAGINLNTFAAREGLSWMKPRAVGLTGATAPTGEPLIGVLAMTLTDDITSSHYRLSPHGIPEGADAGLAISAETFLSRMIVPALARTFHAVADDSSKDFTILGGNRITNSAALKIPFTTDKGTHYTGVVAPHEMEVLLSGDALTLRIRDLAVPVEIVGIRDAETLHLSVEHRLRIELVPAKEDPGHMVLSMSDLEAPKVDHWTGESTALVIAKIGIELVFTIIAAVVSYFVGRGSGAGASFARRLVAAVLFFLIDLVGKGITYIPDLLAHLEAEDLLKLPDFSRFTDIILSEFNWPTEVTYKAVSAQFSDSVLIGIRMR